MASQKIIDYVIVRSVWYNPHSEKNNIEEDLTQDVMKYIANGYVLHGPVNYVYYQNNSNHYCSQAVIKYEDTPPPAYQ